MVNCLGSTSLLNLLAGYCVLLAQQARQAPELHHRQPNPAAKQRVNAAGSVVIAGAGRTEARQGPGAVEVDLADRAGEAGSSRTEAAFPGLGCLPGGENRGSEAPEKHCPD